MTKPLRLIATLAVVAVAGCATVPDQPVVLGTVKPLPPVQVLVVRPCIDLAQIEPVPPTSIPPPTAGVAELANGAAADVLRYRELAKRQNDLLKACAKGPTQ